MDNPTINLSTGITPSTQIPLDSKLYVKTIADLRDLGADDFKAFLYYDSMIVLCKQNQQFYIWLDDGPRFGTDGQGSITSNFTPILNEDFVYPEGSIVNEIDYSLKRYNFYPYASDMLIANTTNINYLLNEVLPNGSNDIISGNVRWTGNSLDFRGTRITYRFNGVIYRTENSVDITLTDNSGSALKRIDTFAVDFETNSIVVIEGDSSVNPLEKNVDFRKQLRISMVLIDEDLALPPDLSFRIVYEENLQETGGEWDTSVEGVAGGVEARLRVDDVSYPETPSLVHCSFKSPFDGEFLVFKHSTPSSYSDLQYLAMKFNPVYGSNISQLYFDVYFYLNGALNGRTYLTNGSYGIDWSLAEYQDLLIPTGDIITSSTAIEFNEIRIGSFNNDLAQYFFTIDNIYLDFGGLPNQSPANYELRTDRSGTASLYKNNVESSQITFVGKESPANALVDLSTVFLSNHDLENASNALVYNIMNSPEPVLNGRAVYLINTTEAQGAPTVLNATQESGTAWVPDTDMHMFVWCKKPGTYVYCFIHTQISSALIQFVTPLEENANILIPTPSTAGDYVIPIKINNKLADPEGEIIITSIDKIYFFSGSFVNTPLDNTWIVGGYNNYEDNDGDNQFTLPTNFVLGDKFTFTKLVANGTTTIVVNPLSTPIHTINGIGSYAMTAIYSSVTLEAHSDNNWVIIASS